MWYRLSAGAYKGWQPAPQWFHGPPGLGTNHMAALRLVMAPVVIAPVISRLPDHESPIISSPRVCPKIQGLAVPFPRTLGDAGGMHDRIGVGQFSEHRQNRLAGGREPGDMMTQGSAGWRPRL